MKREQQSLNDEITRRTREEVFAIARKTLTDLAGTSLEERMSEVFTRRLRELDGEAKEGLAKALKTSSDPVLVRSAFELPSEQRAAIQHALNETFSAEIHVRFETAPDVISGIELTANGRKVAWSIADYLASLEKSVGELLKEQSKPEAKPEAEPETKPSPSRSPGLNLLLPRRPNERAARFFAKCLRPRVRRPKPGARNLHAATDAARGGHDHQRLHGHRPGLRAFPAWALTSW